MTDDVRKSAVLFSLRDGVLSVAVGPQAVGTSIELRDGMQLDDAVLQLRTLLWALDKFMARGVRKK